MSVSCRNFIFQMYILRKCHRRAMCHDQMAISTHHQHSIWSSSSVQHLYSEYDFITKWHRNQISTIITIFSCALRSHVRYVHGRAISASHQLFMLSFVSCTYSYSHANLSQPDNWSVFHALPFRACEMRMNGWFKIIQLTCRHRSRNQLKSTPKHMYKMI